jgi:hypothetical protein
MDNFDNYDDNQGSFNTDKISINSDISFSQSDDNLPKIASDNYEENTLKVNLDDLGFGNNNS